MKATRRNDHLHVPARRQLLFTMVWSLILSSALNAQIIQYANKHIALTGNSLAQFQGGFQLMEFPLVPAANVVIRGQNSYTCAMILPLVSYLVPANSDAVVLLDSTNDIQHNVPVQQHMNCIEQTITSLVARNPAVRIVVANTPPWTHWDPCTSTYRDPSVVQLIQAYNAAYADSGSGLQALWPVNVRLADVFTPSSDQDGWALPQYMLGPCGIHPGNSGIWSASWQHFADAYTGLIMAALKGQW